MHTRLGFSSARALTSILLLTGATLLTAFGCGGSDSSGGGKPTAGAGGDAGDTGDGEGGKGTAGKGSAGKGGAGKGGAANMGSAGSAGEGGDANNGEGGEAGAGTQPSTQHTHVSFMASGAVSKSKNFRLISGTGESLGGTVGSKRSKSLKYTYIPGVIAASSN